MSYGQIAITEIMYDHEGSDSGYEWIEIQNTSSSSIPIVSWYFYENDVHHGLYPDGFDSLAAGERALIVQNIQTIRDEFSGSIALIKSSFSLNNTGESLSISNDQKEIITTVSYSESDGALGNGNSLQRSNTSWIEAAPTPGAANSETTSVPTTPSDSSSNNASKKLEDLEAKEKIEKFTEYTAFIDVTSQAIAGSPVDIDVYVYKASEKGIVKKMKGGKYFVNFGDGAVLESDQQITTSHIYNYPGSYLVTFEFFRNDLEKNSDKDPRVIEQLLINVHEANITITDIDTLGGITLANSLATDIDLGGWELVLGKQSYTFPRYTILSANNSMTVPLRVHRINGSENSLVTIKNESGLVLASHNPFADMAKNISAKTTNIQPKKTTETTLDIDSSENYLDTFLSKYPEKQFINFENSANNQLGASVSETKTVIPTVGIIIAGFVALMLVGIRVFALRDRKSELVNNQEVIGEIELIE